MTKICSANLGHFVFVKEKSYLNLIQKITRFKKNREKDMCILSLTNQRAQEKRIRV